MIDNMDSYIPLPLIMFTCTALRHSLQEWHKNKGVWPQASKVMLKAGKLDDSNYCNNMNDGGNNTPCCGTMGCKY